MARRIKTEVPLKDIFFEQNIYPRASYNWQTGYDYAMSMSSGSKFPPITLCKFNNKLYLIDGKHRLEAHKILKKESIEAEVFVGWTYGEMFEEAIKRNITHGRILSPYEKRMLALKLRKLKYPNEKIGSLLNIPLDKLEKFVAQRLINSITGETISESIVKSPLKHLSGTVQQEEYNRINSSQIEMYSSSQLRMVIELIRLIENDLLEVEDLNLLEKIKYLKELLNRY